ncbi:MAG TPA: FAD-dependent oxidoreductase [Sphingomicrobium sp.]|nr:FAD-dependent oxidoreductase [Sphingomicrobium sp.]
MFIDRRGFALGGSAALLSACATVPPRTRTFANCTPLPRVLVDESRVIRTIAGLRPYRRSGFVVREERLGDKRLVHNYGHGGSGITMSWGTSKLATDLGLQAHSGPVAVLGGGIMGLSTARLVQEAGFSVTIYAAALPPDTTSNVAGGQFHPFALFRDDSVTSQFRQQFVTALDYSWRRFQIMVGDDYGIRWLPTYVETDSPDARLIANYPPVNRMLSQVEHPFPWGSTLRYDTMYVETGRYLRQMIRDVHVAGGKIEVRRFAAPADIGALRESLVFNCTGLGSRELFGDTELQPIRGQLAFLEPQPEVRYAVLGEFGHMFPRADGILIGGTFERDVWDTNPEPTAIARIIASHKRFFESFRCMA